MTDVTATAPRLSASGAELVALAEHFYRRAFAGALVFVGLAGLGAIVMLPLRNSTASVALATPTVLLTALLVLTTPLSVRFSLPLYRALRGRPALELVPVAIAAALLAYPLRSELWWPSCALLMLVALVAPLARTWAYCLLVLLVNLAAHALAGDLDTTPAVSIVGLWIGFGFWGTLSAVFSDRMAAYLMRVEASSATLPPAAPEPADDVVPDAEVVEPRALPAPRAVDDARLQRLTARQLEVVALLADGGRYAEVAACLSISVRQVQRHVAVAVQRLGVHNANELVAVAVAAGLGGARSR